MPGQDYKPEGSGDHVPDWWRSNREQMAKAKTEKEEKEKKAKKDC